jgi:hypothetical protein
LPLNINPTDEANAPLIYAAISAKCSDDGQSYKIFHEARARKGILGSGLIDYNQ